MCTFADKLPIIDCPVLLNKSMKSNNRHRYVRKADYIETFHPEGETALLPFMLEVLTPRSRTEIKSLLSHSHVKVNGTATTQFDTPLQPGDEVLINFTRPFLTLNDRMVHLLYEDPDLVVVEKKSGLLTVPAGNRRERTAQQIVDDYLYASDGHSHAYVCHRLDQYTSGILIFAKNSHVQQLLREAWTSYIVERRYMAICESVPVERKGEVRSYLAENSAMQVYSTKDPQKGKLSVTRYEVLKDNGSYSMVDIQLLTGRKNQIRVHMSDLGCPIAGDAKYGAKTNPTGRMMLHNYLLQFYHPVTHENLRFELPLPKSFQL